MKIGPLELSGSFLLLTALLHYLDDQCLVLLALLACLLHEGGHWLALRKLNIPVTRIRVTAVGAEMQLGGPLSYHQEILVALAGPAVNLALALPFAHLPFGQLFAGIHLSLALFNLLPIHPLDGGRIVRAILSLALGPLAADRIGHLVNTVFVALLLAAGTLLAGLGGRATLLLTALWLLLS